MAMKDWDDFESALINGANIEDLLGIKLEETSKVSESQSAHLSKENLQPPSENGSGFNLEQSLSVTFPGGTVLPFTFPHKLWTYKVSASADVEGVSSTELVGKPFVPLSCILTPSLLPE